VYKKGGVGNDRSVPTREVRVREVKALETRAGNTRFVLVDNEGDEYTSPATTPRNRRDRQALRKERSRKLP
jgi:hypothetical protein